jgi:DNA-binding CsgD family transcriptional regulator
VESARPSLEGEMGLAGATFAWHEGELRFGAMIHVGDAPEEAKAVFFGGAAHLTEEERRAAYQPGPSALHRVSDRVRQQFGHSFEEAPSLAGLRACGVRDFLAAYGMDPSAHHGYVLAAALPTRPTLSRGEVARWSRLRAHLLAGLRLQLQPTEPDAVLSSAGQVVHAERAAVSEGARAALRAAAVRIDRIRSGRERSDPDAALAVWQGLVSGRWSLVDHFDSDGRRYVVARRNEAILGAPRALSMRERQVVADVGLGRTNKEIAYELGLAPSTISSHLANAMRALRVRNRAALAALGPLFDDDASRAPHKVPWRPRGNG